MKTNLFVRRAAAVALVSLAAGCATWNDMERSEKGTAAGATGGALAGAAVGGPIGAAVGAGIGGYVGHHQSSETATSNRAGQRADAGTTRTGAAYDAEFVRSVQQSLSQKGFDPGPVDGQWGPGTESALRQFQRANGLSESGSADDQSLAALGVSRSLQGMPSNAGSIANPQVR